MKKKYLYIILTYVSIHLSSFIAMPIILMIGISFFNMDENEMRLIAAGIWIIISFSIGFAVTMYLLKQPDPYQLKAESKKVPMSQAITWAVGGIFLAFFAQFAAVLLEQAIGIEPGSENTAQIIELIRQVPLAILVSSIIGPILEEIVFRKVIFGTLYNRFPFGIAAVLSSLAFSLAHFEITHLILYAAMGFTFAFLYVITGRIIVPIISHMAMNTLVTIAQFTLIDKEIEQLQSMIGGLFW